MQVGRHLSQTQALGLSSKALQHFVCPCSWRVVGIVIDLEECLRLSGVGKQCFGIVSCEDLQCLVNASKFFCPGADTLHPLVVLCCASCFDKIEQLEVLFHRHLSVVQLLRRISHDLLSIGFFSILLLPVSHKLCHLVHFHACDALIVLVSDCFHFSRLLEIHGECVIHVLEDANDCRGGWVGCLCLFCLLIVESGWVLGEGANEFELLGCEALTTGQLLNGLVHHL